MSKTVKKLALFLLLCIFACSQEQRETETELSARGRQVVDYLLADWEQQFRSTSIALAMRNLGMDAADELRLEVGDYFRGHTDLSNNLKWWGANNYLLSNDEKRIAKYLITTFEKEARLPDPQEAAAALELPESELRSRLAFMAKAGLLQEERAEKLGYVLAEGYGKWGGPLRYNFYTVAVADGKPFDVW